MNYRTIRIQVFGGIFAAALAISGCGSDNEILTISPIGPTIVEKGTTLQFTASQSDVTWSVDGGTGNGTISAGGLYTPPSTLPVGEPEITVVAEDSDGDIAEATVSLRTADTVTLGSAAPVNQTPISLVGLIDFGIGFNSNRIAVGLASVHEMSVFTGDNAGTANVFLSKALDFGSFVPVNLTNDAVVNEYSSAIELDSQLNPHILFVRGDILTDEVQMFMTSSNDQGANFEEAVPLTSAPPDGTSQIMGFMTQDGNDGLHVVFSNLNDVANTGEIVYTRSTDGGQTWSSPVNVETGADELIFPSVAVTPDGSKVYVAFYDAALGRVVFSRSLDGGANFSDTIPLSTVANTAAPFTKVALDSTGAVYVAMCDDVDTNATFEAILRKSTNEGASFSPGVTINSDGTNTNAVIANMSIDDLGRIDVVWTSDSDTSGDFDTLNYSRSVDAGASFGESEVVASGPDGSAVISRGIRHDESGRLYIQYIISDLGFTSGDIFVRRGE